jgi:transposase
MAFRALVLHFWDVRGRMMAVDGRKHTGAKRVAGKDAAVLSPQPQYTPPTDEDRKVFAALIPADHYLRRAAMVIDFERFRPWMAARYSPDMGRPAKEPILLLKLEFLQYHDRLSDERVVAAAQVNVAYREFLDLGMHSPLPDPSLLSRFRGRLGAEVHRRIFDELVTQAREYGLVKDRLRLKDATHVIANVAIPSAIRLVAAMRGRLLEALSVYDAEWAAGQHIRAEMIRSADAGAAVEQRLECRVTHLREIVAWAEALLERLRASAAGADAARERLEQVLQWAHKVLHDRDHPQAGDKMVSLEETDARFGYHHGSYCGYLLDLIADPDSELITSLDVLPANGDEAADAAALVRREEEAQQNDVQALSADAVLFQGEKLRELTDPQGLNLEVFVPPVEPAHNACFTPNDFHLDETGRTLTCPAGQQTSTRDRNRRDTGWAFVFNHAACAACAQREKCMAKSSRGRGRSVNKSDYAHEYAAVRAKAQTEEYAAVRKVHRKVERKLGEMVRHHGGRRARYRGRPKVLLQQLMTALVVNAKRMVRLLCAQQTLQATE